MSSEPRDVATRTRDALALLATPDVDLEQSLAIDENPALAESCSAQVDWDPRQSTGYVFPVLRPHRVQAWREANEMTGRTLMRDGTWTERHDHTP